MKIQHICSNRRKESTYFIYMCFMMPFSVSYNPTNVMEGDELRIICNITPRLDGVTTNWELNGSTYRTSVQPLILKNVSQKVSGTWSCLVRHKRNQAKASASLQVQGMDFHYTAYLIVSTQNHLLHFWVHASISQLQT